MQLKAKNDTEKRLLDYLEANASDALKEKIAALPEHGYNLDAAYRHIRDEARKKLNSGGGFIADEVVFGWLVHYYEDVAPAEAARAEKAREEAAKKKESAAPEKGPEKRTRKRKPAKAGVGQNGQPVDGAGASKSVTNGEAQCESGGNAVSTRECSTPQDAAVPRSGVASSTPPSGGSQEQRRTDGGGGFSPESDAPPTPASLPVSGASDSGFAFILFDADEKKGGEA